MLIGLQAMPGEKRTDTTSKRLPDFALLGVIGFGLAITTFVERRIFVDPLALNDDVRNQVYWMARLVDPSLFPHDYIASYFTQPMVVSPVLSGLYGWLAHWFNPLTITQAMPFFTMTLATVFLYQFAKQYKNTIYAVCACFAFQTSIWIFKNMAGGLSRSFIYPLLFFLFWQMSSQNWWGVTLCLCLATLIYPPAFFLGLGLLALEVILQARRDPHTKGRLLSFCGSLAFGLGALFWKSHQAVHEAFGPLNSNQSTDGVQDFLPGGRIVLYPWGNISPYMPDGLQWLGALLERLPHPYIIIPTVVFILVLLLYNRFLAPRLGQLAIPPLVWRLLAVSGLLYVLAWATLFYLYVPERFFQYSLPLVPTFLFAGVLYLLYSMFHRTKPWIYIGFAVLCLAVTSLFWRDDLMKPDPPHRELFAYLKPLPSDSLIAAAPGLASDIPLYSLKSVLISNEAYIPFHRDYFRTIKKRYRDWLVAYYAQKPEQMANYLKQNHVAYWVIQDEDFESGRLGELADYYYYAFPPAFFEGLTLQDRTHYFKFHIPAEAVVFHNSQFTVVDAHRLIKIVEKKGSSEQR